MATYTFPTDQHRLIEILSLDRYEYDPNSTLHSLMTDQQDWDAARGVDTITPTLAAMTEWEALYAEYLTESAKQSVTSISVAGEYSQSNATPLKDTYDGRLNSLRVRILKLLDPAKVLSGMLGSSQSRVFVT